MSLYQHDLIRRNGVLLSCLDESERDYSICASAVYSNPIAIKFVPVEHIDDEMLEHVIQSGEQYLSLIPEECINDYHVALMRNLYPYAERFMDEEIILDRRGQALMERIHAIIETA
ncbi:hypothetical protein HLH17_02175 [Acinetobacter sp. ANC 5380]|uniref:Uncharacterized protein n=1 Tax=Acinetobacter terrae TaxID=2731247 RepID=A0A7Y2RD67_9GAMM|nr:hypothetical protein [Acinetobacter terrae]NNH76508.1 hypothetical protein [Acinetobacter terrae]